MLVVNVADAATPASPDEPAATKAFSAEGPHWIGADGSWGCTALSTVSGCTSKPDPAEVKAVKAALDLRRKANSLTDHIVTLEAERASALKQAERAEADAHKFKPQGGASRKLLGACHGSNCGGFDITNEATHHLVPDRYMKCGASVVVAVGIKKMKNLQKDEKTTAVDCASGCSNPDAPDWPDVDANGNQRECKMTHSFTSASGHSCSFQVHAKYTCNSAGVLDVKFYQLNWHESAHSDCIDYKAL